MRITAGPVQWTPKKKRMVLVLFPLGVLLAVPWVSYLVWLGIAHPGQFPSRLVAGLGYFGTVGVIALVIWLVKRYKFNDGREDDQSE